MRERGRPRQFDRAAALRRAMEVFWARGYEGTSVSDLTGALEINRPSLYAAFGNKEALFREAVELYDHVEGEAARRVLDEAPTARAAVEGMLRENAVSYADPARPPGCMIVLAAAVGAAESADVRAFLAERRRDSHEALRSRIQKGIDDGELPPETDAGSLAEFYVTVLHGLSIQARDGATAGALEHTVQHAMRAWDALAAPG